MHDVAESSAAGIPTVRTLEAHPSLNAELVRIAAIYVKADPPRGRPHAVNSLPEGAVVLTDRTVPRRRKDGSLR
ncbi:hypothetical protein [Shinella sp. NM-101]|uniref:hypothetical protein n=1 Tax=Shinella sp. NM-101 TaxID=2744455 RepID=UPI00351D26FC